VLDHLKQRVMETLAQAQLVTLASSGPGGLQADVFPCQALGLRLYVMLPCTSDHLVNLESDPAVVVAVEDWQIRGLARVLAWEEHPAELGLVSAPDADWSEVIEIRPTRVGLGRREGWGYEETIDLT
jgi:hypothetical protein